MSEGDSASRFGARELAPHEIDELLRRGWWGTLATSADGEPYGVPVVYGYDGERFYIASAPGKKIRNIEANANVCLTVVETDGGPGDWASVLVLGHAELVRGIRGHLDAVRALRAQVGRRGEVTMEDAKRLARAKVIAIVPREVTGRARA
ncbi:MAG: pyridoxamine 5'-phosphate oxidase family protein [Gemmatimonadota bacterium]